MTMTPLKLSVLAISISLLAQSCARRTYAQNTPPPVYSQPPPPAPEYNSPPPQTQQAPPPPQTEVSLTISSGQPAPPPQQAPPPVSYQSFYDELSPYGQWISTPEYGYVWLPSAGPNFQPYATSGYWVLTNYGWTWVSNYPWGWAPFHYGTWQYDAFMGWFWIPGYQWAPAWVSWRSCNGYYGWAPLGPNYVNGGYATYNAPPERYVFVNASYMNNPNMGRYYEPQGMNGTYYNRSAVISNTYYDKGSNNTYYAGPPLAEVQRYNNAPLQPVTVVQSGTPERQGMNGGQISMFRPSVQQPPAQNAQGGNQPQQMPAPSRVYQRSEVTPAAQRPVLTQPNQPRVAPYKAENSQPSNQPSQPNNQPQQREDLNRPHQPTEQQPPVQQEHPVQQQPAQQPPMQQPPKQQPPVQQQPAPQQQPPKQQPPPAQQPPAQQQHAATPPPARQQPQQQPKPQGGNRQQKPGNNKAQPAKQQPQGQQQPQK